MRLRGPVICIIILFMQCATVRADYPDAAKAYESGEYTYAFNEYRALAERGDVRAQVNTGWMYYHGEGVGKDKVQALEWFRKAAEQGDITSMFNLAYGYEHGDGVTRDVNESRRWYGKAAEQRNALERVDFERLTNTFLIPDAAQSRIAKALAEQKRIPSAKASGETPIAAGAATVEVARVRTAAPEEENNWDTAASTPVETPPVRSVKKDNEGSVVSPSTTPEREVFQNPRLEGIRRAAEVGDRNAQVALGWIYSSGKEIPVDKAKAARWYRLAAENGNLNAQVALGWMYYEGRGIERNLEESALWYGKAAAQGDIKAGQMLQRIKLLLRRE